MKIQNQKGRAQAGRATEDRKSNSITRAGRCRDQRVQDFVGMSSTRVTQVIGFPQYLCAMCARPDGGDVDHLAPDLLGNWITFAYIMNVAMLDLAQLGDNLHSNFLVMALTLFLGLDEIQLMVSP